MLFVWIAPIYVAKDSNLFVGFVRGFGMQAVHGVVSASILRSVFLFPRTILLFLMYCLCFRFRRGFVWGAPLRVVESPSSLTNCTSHCDGANKCSPNHIDMIPVIAPFMTLPFTPILYANYTFTCSIRLCFPEIRKTFFAVSCIYIYIGFVGV